MLSLPNILTLARIAAVPVVVVLILLDDHLWRWLALAVYAVACVTDYLDGYLARMLDTQSDSAVCSTPSPIRFWSALACWC